MENKINIPTVEATSLDVMAAEKEKLKAVFPECFVEGKLDIDKLLSLCGEFIDNDFEKYKFEWNGKSACYRTIAAPTLATLRPCPEESVDFDKTNNLYIEGDNLEVLKILQKAYFRKVKMIYIDPPYNTGNDFVYEDDYRDPLARYKEVTSQTTKSNPETMGRFHTNWLNMMYPRLRLAANLLRDDGVIFISIDDNEVTNLRKLCDEVFGEENCLGQLIWSLSSGPQAGHFTRSHEYILAYAKRRDSLGWFEDKSGGVISHGALKKISPANPASDVVFPKGSISCEASDIEFPNELGESEKEYITAGRLKFQNHLLSEDVTIRAGWAMKNQLLSWLKGDETYDSKGQKVVRFFFNSKGILFYEKERGTTHPKTVLTADIVGNTKKGSDCILELFKNKIMDFPKPVDLVKFFANLVTKDNDIILDFFSGSATTAHAVMQLNAEDGGNRRFIMVQLPELCPDNSDAAKAGYKNICEIGKERIRRAGGKIKGQNSASLLETARETPLDTGFKVFKLDSSNLIAWDSSPIEPGDVETLFKRYEQWSDRIKRDRSQKDLVYEIMFKLGIPLTYPVTEERINGRLVHIIGEDCLVAVCLDGSNGGVQPEDIEALCEKCPAKIVASEDAFADNVALTNAHYILEEKHIELMLI